VSVAVLVYEYCDATVQASPVDAVRTVPESLKVGVLVSVARQALGFVSERVPVSKTIAFRQTPATSCGDLKHCRVVRKSGARRRGNAGTAIGFVCARGDDGCDTNREEDTVA
jgi:hypothetical protein